MEPNYEVLILRYYKNYLLTSYKCLIHQKYLGTYCFLRFFTVQQEQY